MYYHSRSGPVVGAIERSRLQEQASVSGARDKKMIVISKHFWISKNNMSLRNDDVWACIAIKQAQSNFEPIDWNHSIHVWRSFRFNPSKSTHVAEYRYEPWSGALYPATSGGVS